MRKQSRKPNATVDAALSAYYDSLTDEEREEIRSWGEFAETQFPDDKALSEDN